MNKTMKTILACLSLCFAVPVIGDADEPAADLKTVKARTIEVKIPKTWEEKDPTSMRPAQFTIPGKPNDAELVIFYFGGPTGGVKANVERWIGQFQKEGLELNMYQGKCTAGNYILVDTKGTWNKPDGPPFARKTVPAPNSRVLNVILIEELKGGDKDYYFLKLSGDQDIVGQQTKALRTAIGADIKSEKKFELKDAQ
jgi:hypothetical protein